jgi:hypothetical protein
MFFVSEDSEAIIGNVYCSNACDCAENSNFAFKTMEKILQKKNFGIENIVRQWNYIGNILNKEDGRQNYQDFNNVRSVFYEGKFSCSGYPAATGIGMCNGGVVIEFVAVKSKQAISCPVENPDQVAAHKYSQKVLAGHEFKQVATPKFERARFFGLNGLKMIFISGTASILGENSVEIDNPAGQTEITIQNIERLYSSQILSGLPIQKLQPVYGHARVYIKNKKDYPVIKKQFRKHYGNLPVVYLIADVCREELLVEIEGTIILH